MKIILLCPIIVLLSLFAYTQVEVSYENYINSSETDYRVISHKSNIYFVVNHENEDQINDSYIEIIVLDTNLKELEKTNYYYKNFGSICSATVSDSIFTISLFKSNKNDSSEIIIINKHFGKDLKTYSLKFEKDILVESCFVFKNDFFINVLSEYNDESLINKAAQFLGVKNYVPKLFKFSFVSKKIKEIKIGNEFYTYNIIQFDSSNNYKIIAISDSIYDNSFIEIYINDNIINYNRKYIYCLDNSNNYLSLLDDFNSNQFIYGSFNSLERYSFDDIVAKKSSSKGLFIKDNSNCNYVLFENLKSFKYFNYSIYRSFKASNKINSQKNIQYQILLHKPLEIDNEILLLAEVYTPEFQTEYYTIYTFGVPETHSREIFVGYRFSTAIIMGFNKDLELVWDNYILLNEIIEQDVHPHINLFKDEMDIVICYAYNGKLTYKKINKYDVIEGKERVYLYGKLQQKENYIINHKLAYWYSNYFLSHGINEMIEKKLDKAFKIILSKIAYY